MLLFPKGHGGPFQCTTSTDRVMNWHEIQHVVVILCQSNLIQRVLWIRPSQMPKRDIVSLCQAGAFSGFLVSSKLFCLELATLPSRLSLCCNIWVYSLFFSLTYYAGCRLFG